VIPGNAAATAPSGLSAAGCLGLGTVYGAST